MQEGINLSPEELTKYLNAEFRGILPEVPFAYIAYDSRKLVFPTETLFLALKGDNRDGHKYIKDAWDKGVRCFLVSQWSPEFPLAAYWIVEEVLQAFQHLAALVRSKYQGLVIGITGSNGKTTVKEWLYQLLQSEVEVYRSPKSYNSQLGVPLSIMGLNVHTQVAIFEAGISQPDEMATLQTMIQPNWGVMTSFGAAHGEHFSSDSDKLYEKFKLFTNVEKLFYSIDNERVDFISLQLKWNSTSPQLLTWSLSNKTATLSLISIKPFGRIWKMTVSYGNQTFEVPIPFSDKASLSNALCAALIAIETTKQPALIFDRLAGLTPVAMRMEMKEGIHQTRLLNDAWSLDLSSLQIALDHLSSQHDKKRKTVILSDFKQGALRGEALYQRVAGLLQKFQIDRLIGIGPEISFHASAFTGFDTHFFQSTRNFLKVAPELSFSQESILIKGARAFGFEEIEKFFTRQRHRTVLEIDLDALIYNYKVYQGLLRPGVKMMVMVKAFSYGSGISEVAKLMQFHQADYLTVAYADEGILLRQAGIHLPIMVMNTDSDSFDSCFNWQLEPEIYSITLLKALITRIQEREEEKKVGVHLSFDTGMNRLGLNEEEIDELLILLKMEPRLEIRSIYTHLVASDEPQHRNFTNAQIERFERAANKVTRGLSYQPYRHVLNSSGIPNFPNAQYEMVRLGIGLYGFEGSGTITDKLKPVSCLKTVVSQVRQVKQGESVGYSRKGVVQQDSMIATLAIGYADGVSRSFGNGAVHFWLKGKLVPTIGNICMDMCMVDVSGIDVVEGDEVEIFGPNNPILNIAKAIGTIPYELLTNVSQRVKRVYLKD